MRKFTADLVFVGNGDEIKNGIIICADDGRILEVLNPETTVETAEAEYFPGALCPGFVNTHCHLEYSWVKGKIEPGLGLSGFIQAIETLKNSHAINEKKKQDFLLAADQEMHENGIIAVGDLSNDSNSFNIKKNSKLYYHTFIELLGFHPEKAAKEFARGMVLWEKLEGNLKSITLHAPYSVSESLLVSICNHAKEHGYPLTMHNQESEAEDELFREKKGDILERLSSFGIPTDFFIPSGKSSLQSVFDKFPAQNKLLLVHNTFTSQSDIQFAIENHPRLYFCFCPNANLFITGKLPDIPHFLKLGANITLGTDSLASNHQLNILEEMKSIHLYFPQIPLGNLIFWATLQGAEFLGISKEFGSFEKGKKPGINYLHGTGIKGGKMESNTCVKRLI